MKHRQTIAIVGSGAVGGYYGARLAEAGHEVHFLMRRDYEAVREGGLTITSPDGDFALATPAVARTTEEIGPVDWVICALKTTGLAEARQLLAPCVKDQTRILLLMNGLGVEDELAGWFGAERIFGGMAFTCINRGRPGYIHHLAHGPISLGHFQNDPSEIETAVGLWRGSKTRVSASQSLLRARWEKLCWNIPFNGMAIAAGGITTDVIVNTPDLRAATRMLMEEVVQAGNADLAAHCEEARIDGPAIIERMFFLTDTMGPYRPSTMIDFVEGRAMEIETMFGEPLRRAETLAVSAPGLSLMTAVLRRLNVGR